jgi:ATP-dependent exoDNAse (exonuclease V) beta subunit
VTVFLTEFHVFDRLMLLPEGQETIGNIHNFVGKLRGASYAVTVAGYLYLLESGLVELTVSSCSSAGERVKIMTMHASKGLEYPVVIIFDVGAKFNKSDARSMMVVDKTCGLCVYSTDTVGYVRTDSIARIGAGIKRGRVMIAEEMRLLYVALTRAKQHLLIMGAVDVSALSVSHADFDILSSGSYADFLAPTVKRNVQECNFLFETETLSDIKIIKHESHGRVLAGSANEELVQELRDIYNTPYAHDEATTVILKNSVTSLTRNEEAAVDFTPHVTSRKDRGTEYGTQFHKKMQCADFTKSNPDPEVQKCIDALRPFLSGMQVYKELVFLSTEVLSNETVLVQGVIDLLLVSTEKAILVDYKTTNASRDKLVELYCAQLGKYADAVRGSLSVPLEKYIYSIFHGMIPVD